MSYIFLLGGMDLEMQEIKNLFIANNLDFKDNNLKWGAKWTDYETTFQEENTENTVFVGIELGEKDKKPENAFDIDHHNFNSDKPSSLEQIVDFINENKLTKEPVKLTRKQTLIAANDKGYIPAMEVLCATDEEIKGIRVADRKAQGVMEEDEKMARETVDKIPKKELEKECVVVKSLTDKFSAVRDRLWFDKNIRTNKKLIIYNDESLTYYGPVTEELTEHYKNEIDEGKAYFGGSSSNGFFGLSKGSWTNEEIENQIDDIVDKVSNHNEQPPYSYHIFLFPFRWKFRESNNPIFSGDKKTVNDLKDKINKEFWNEYNFKFKDSSKYNTYNEYSYFYPHVRDFLGISKQETPNFNILQFEYKKGRETPTFNIFLKGIKYTLDIEDVLLSLYPDGVGIFMFVLENNNHPKAEDILKINDYGRRVYPQYLGTDYPLTSDIKGNLLPDKISLNGLITEYGALVEEDFSYYNTFENISALPFILPAHIGKLLGKAFYNEQGIITDIETEPIIDDRMFVISYIINTKLFKPLAKWDDAKKQYGYETDGFWYKYLFVDSDNPSCHSEHMKPKQLKEHTYDRWIENKYEGKLSGQLFGTSRYSFVVLAPEDWFNRNIITNHIKYIYFQIVLLSLIQRAYLILFGVAVARLSSRLQTLKIDLKELRAEINRLYLNYIKFVNRIYFREITAQEQGIELYDILQDKMRINRDVKDLDREISELNQYLDTKEAGELNKIANLFLPVGLLAAIMGMSTLQFLGKTSFVLQFDKVDWILTALSFTSILAIIWAVYAIIKYFKNNKL